MFSNMPSVRKRPTKFLASLRTLAESAEELARDSEILLETAQIAVKERITFYDATCVAMANVERSHLGALDVDEIGAPLNYPEI